MRVVLAPLAITFLLQVMASMAEMAVPVLAPILTAEAGLAPERVGNFASLNFLGALWFLTINAQVMPVTGPLRLLQIGNLLAAVGLVVVLPGTGWALFAGALLIGIGYGPMSPGGSQILAQATPERMRSLVFSIKQAGVPLGGALAGLLVPWLAAQLGWRAALAVIALALLTALAAVQPWRRCFDAARDPEQRLRPGALLSPAILKEPLRALRLHSDLPRLTLAGTLLGMGQGCVFTFLVTYLVDRVGLALATAGLAFAALQATGVVGRISAGWLADRTRSARRTLQLLSIVSAATCLLLAALDDGGRPLGAIVAVCALAGAAMASWNGVCLAEVARVAPAGKVGDATAGATFFIFLGIVIAPSVFAALVEAFGSYDTAFWALGVVVLGAALVLAPLAARE